MRSPLPDTLRKRRSTNSPDGSRRPSRRQFLAGVGVVATAVLSGCNALDTREEAISREFDYSSVSALSVDCDGGPVDLRPIPGDVVEVDAIKKARGDASLDDFEFEAALDGATLSVVANEPNVVGFGGASIEIEVGIPGPVDVADLRVDDGTVDVSDVRADVVADIGDGALDVSGVDGYVDAVVQDGTVDVSDPAGIDGIATEDGAVTVDVPSLREDATVRADDGAVDVTLGADLDATVVATIDDGQILGVDSLDDVTKEIHDDDTTEVRGKVGDATHTLTVHSSDGVVDLGRVS